MADMPFLERRRYRRLAEDAISACNRHYGPFVDAVVNPLIILSLLDMVDRAASANDNAALRDVCAESARQQAVEGWAPEPCSDEPEMPKRRGWVVELAYGAHGYGSHADC